MINKFMDTLFNLISSDCKYFIWYKNICQRAKNRILSDGIYNEMHHVLPKSIFPQYKKNPENLVKLTAREHFICHWLLTKFIDNPKIIYAFQMMMPNKTGNRYIPKSSIVYQQLKNKFSLNNKGTKGHIWITNGKDNRLILFDSVLPFGFYPGRTFSQSHKKSLKGIPKTIEQKEKQSRAMKGKPGLPGELNPAKREEVRKKISKARSGTTASEETKLKMKLSKLGKKLGSYKFKSIKHV
jgi:hypothetical protein